MIVLTVLFIAPFLLVVTLFYVLMDICDELNLPIFRWLNLHEEVTWPLWNDDSSSSVSHPLSQKPSEKSREK